MLWVAFFRNLNLGHRGSPVRSQLEDAFAAAGASSVRSFQTNGTVIFDPGALTPEAVVDRARPLLLTSSGYDDIAPCQHVEELAEIVSEHAADAWNLLLNTFDRASMIDGWSAGDELTPGLTLVDTGPGFALTRLVGAADPVDPNPVIERLTGLRNTTRSLTTVVRLTASLGLTSDRVPERREQLPDDLAAALALNPRSASAFDRLPPSHRRQYVAWIEQAKRPETRGRRITQTVERSARAAPSQPA